MVNILFLSDNFPPEVNAPASRTFDHCKEWVKKGAKVTVITSVPNFPQGKVYQGYRNKLYQTEVVDGIRVIRVWTFITANQGFLLRIIDYLSFALASFIVGLFQRCDIVIATSPQFFCALSGWAVAKIRRKPWIFEVRDLWPESIKAVGAMKDSFIIRMLEKLEIFLYRQANKIVVVTNSFKDNMIARGIDSNKIDFIPNGVDTKLFSKDRIDPELKSKLGLDGKFVVGYIGTHGMAHALDFILKAAKAIEAIPELEKVHFLFVGDGAEKENLIALSKELELKNVTFHPPVPKDRAVQFLNMIDVALVNLKRCETFLKVIPSKIYEAAALGKPILLGVEGEAREVVEQSGFGICFEPENPRHLIESLTEITRSGVKLVAPHGKESSQGLDRSKQADHFFFLLTKECL